MPMLYWKVKFVFLISELCAIWPVFVTELSDSYSLSTRVLLNKYNLLFVRF